MKTKNKLGRQAGFTLIEILVVVLIIGLLIGVVGPNVWNTFIRSQKGVAEQQIANLVSSVSMFELNNTRLPDSLEELTEPDAITGKPWLNGSLPPDPWGNEYVYDMLPDGGFEIVSYGKDGMPGGEGENADISSREEEE
ncbi:MAG: type II secretion system major pseudopilin GspG [Planctomycetota bacterium]|jgi:general secretion pathway protein G|nr:type II secretion system major pseudopilin GspG [Planctomycetota bacterium]